MGGGLKISRTGGGGLDFQVDRRLSSSEGIDFAKIYGFDGVPGSFSEEHVRLGTCRKPVAMPDLFTALEKPREGK